MPMVTIDGPSGVGKSAVARELARRLGCSYLSLGLIYRALAWASLQHQALNNHLLTQLDLVPVADEGGTIDPKIVYQGRDITSLLYGDAQVEALCSTIAQQPSVRHLAKSFIQRYASNNHLVVEGRTAHRVIEGPSIQIFLWAHPLERERRNRSEYERIGRTSESAHLAALAHQRDQFDLARAVDPLRLEQGMIAWDSTYAIFNETVEELLRWIRHHDGSQPLAASVIIPVHNRAEHLALSLRYLGEQTLPRHRYEILVVDDGSIDAVAGWAGQYGAEVITIPHQGPGAARNAGLHHAQGEVIIFLDADMLVLPDFLEQHLNLHARANSLAVQGARRHLPAEVMAPRPLVARRDSREAILDRHSYNLTCLRYPWSLAYSCNLSVARSLLRHECFDESFVAWGLEDLEFAYRLDRRGSRWAFSRRVAGYHLHHDRAMTVERFQGWQRNLDHFKQKHPGPGVESLSHLAPAFDPRVHANFLEQYEHLNATVPESNPAVVFQAASVAGDPLVAIQNYVYQSPEAARDLFVIDDEHRADYEIMLAAICPGTPVRFYTPADWERLRDVISARYVSNGCAIEEIKPV